MMPDKARYCTLFDMQQCWGPKQENDALYTEGGHCVWGGGGFPNPSPFN